MKFKRHRQRRSTKATGQTDQINQQPAVPATGICDLPDDVVIKILSRVPDSPASRVMDTLRLVSKRFFDLCRDREVWKGKLVQVWDAKRLKNVTSYSHGITKLVLKSDDIAMNDVIGAVQKNPQLEELTVTIGDSLQPRRALFLSLEKCPSLSRLHLTGYTDKVFTCHFEHLKDNTNLTDVGLSLTDETITQSLASLRLGCPQLRSLDLTLFCSKKATLMSIFLDGTLPIKKLRINERGQNAIEVSRLVGGEASFISTMSGLTELAICCYEITIRTLRMMLRHCSHLTSFDLSSCKLCDSEFLQILPYLQNLTSLAITEAPISDYSLSMVGQKCKNLQNFAVSGERVSLAGVTKILKAYGGRVKAVEATLPEDDHNVNKWDLMQRSFPHVEFEEWWEEFCDTIDVSITMV